MRLTTRTNLAMRTLMFCAVNSDQLVRKADVAEYCNASENHLALVIHMLAQAGFIETTRGRHGGIRLSKPPEDIVVGEVFRHFESDVPLPSASTAKAMPARSPPAAGCARRWSPRSTRSTPRSTGCGWST
jgi:Rrf2 family nitric oxide-sensitive transcriptional repressor